MRFECRDNMNCTPSTATYTPLTLDRAFGHKASLDLELTLPSYNHGPEGTKFEKHGKPKQAVNSHWKKGWRTPVTILVSFLLGSILTYVSFSKTNAA